MTFSAYVERQKSIIRRRAAAMHNIGKEKEQILKIKARGELLYELAHIKGLNTAERQYFGSKLSLTK